MRDARVFDGRGLLDADSVLVADGLIREVGGGVEPPRGVPILDSSGGTLLPGLIDAHVHAYPAGLRDALRFGTTTVLDMFTEPGWLDPRRAARAGTAPTAEADIWSAGYLATAPEGHGTQFGLDIPTLAPGEDAATFVAARLREGSDYLKIVVEDGSAYPWLDLPTLSMSQVRALIEAAHEQGVLAVVHVSTTDTAVAAAEAGADALVHLPADLPLMPAQVDRLAAAGTPVVTTLSQVAGLACAPDAARLAEAHAPYLSDGQQAGLAAEPFDCLPAGLDHAMANLAALHEAGVPILAGTDTLNPGVAFGVSLLGELSLLVAAGLSPVAALTATTAGPAAVFGLNDRGRIAPGMRADLLLVDGDPLGQIESVFGISQICENGSPVDRTPVPASGQPG